MASLQRFRYFFCRLSISNVLAYVLEEWDVRKVGCTQPYSYSRLKSVERLFTKHDPLYVGYESRTYKLSVLNLAPKPLGQHDILQFVLLTFFLSLKSVI